MLSIELLLKLIDFIFTNLFDFIGYIILLLLRSKNYKRLNNFSLKIY
jgi:hypothetical protein